MLLSRRGDAKKNVARDGREIAEYGRRPWLFSLKGGMLRISTDHFRYCEVAAVAVSGCLLTVMAYMITIDVVLRFLFDAPLPASVEISQLLEPYVIFLPMAYTLAVGGHVQVTVVTMHLSAGLQRILQTVVLVIDLIFFGSATWFAWEEFYSSFIVDEIMLAAIKLPWWAGKFAMPLGLALITLECIIQLGFTLRRAKPLWQPMTSDETRANQGADAGEDS